MSDICPVNKVNSIKEKHLFFCCYGGGHVNMLLPIIQKAQLEGYKTTVLGLTTAHKTLSQYNISYIGFKDLLQYEDDPNYILALGGKLTQGKTHPDIPQLETDAYHGLSYRDLLLQYGEEEAEEIYAKKNRIAFYPLYTLTKLLRNIQPDCVISTNSPRAERASVVAASSLGIKSLCIVDLFPTIAVQWLKQPEFATYICVLHPMVKNFILEKGGQDEHIKVTGNTAFDSLSLEPDPRIMKDIKQRHSLTDNQKVILWASQPEPEYYPYTDSYGNPNLPRQVDKHLIDLLEEHTDWHVIIRPHPSEQVDLSKYNMLSRVSISDNKDHLHTLLHICDVIVTFSSTVGLEAKLIGKPVISIMQSVHASSSVLKKFSIAHEVHSLEDLSKALNEILLPAMENESNYLAKDFNVGRALEAIWEVIHLGD